MRIRPQGFAREDASGAIPRAGDSVPLPRDVGGEDARPPPPLLGARPPGGSSGGRSPSVRRRRTRGRHRFPQDGGETERGRRGGRRRPRSAPATEMDARPPTPARPDCPPPASAPPPPRPPPPRPPSPAAASPAAAAPVPRRPPPLLRPLSLQPMPSRPSPPPFDRRCPCGRRSCGGCSRGCGRCSRRHFSCSRCSCGRCSCDHCSEAALLRGRSRRRLSLRPCERSATEGRGPPVPQRDPSGEERHSG